MVLLVLACARPAALLQAARGSASLRDELRPARRLEFSADGRRPASRCLRRFSATAQGVLARAGEGTAFCALGKRKWCPPASPPTCARRGVLARRAGESRKWARILRCSVFERWRERFR
ncbi:MAG: hypothetical protein U0324_31550 [Polyangiales bacterium]